MRSLLRIIIPGISVFTLFPPAQLCASVTAIITTPGDTQHLAGFTFEQFSAWDSTFTSPDTEIAYCHWDFGDGSQDDGWQVAHKYASPATPYYTVTLTVYGDSGSSSSNSTTTTIATVAPTFQQTWYVDSNPFVGSDGNIGTDPAFPLLTLATAVVKESAWIATISGVDNGAGAGVWTRIRLRRGNSGYPYSVNIADSITPGYSGRAPCLVDTWDGGTLPIISLPTKAGGYDVTINARWTNSFGYSIYWKDLAFQWPLQAKEQKIENHIPGSQLDNVSLTYGDVRLEGTKETVYGTAISGGYLYGIYAVGDWKMLAHSSVSGSGNSSSTDHQAYFSQGTYYGIRQCTFDGTAVACYSGLKTSGGQKMYVADNFVTGTPVGFDVGSNSDNRVGQNAVYERNHLKNIGTGTRGSSVGFWMTWVYGYRFYNNIIESIGGYPQDVFEIVPSTNVPVGSVSHVKICHNTIYDCSVSALGLDASPYWNNIIFENNVIDEVDFQSYFVNIDNSGFRSLTLTCDGNCYYRSGTITGGLFFDGTSARSLADWQTIDGLDAHGQFADPKFVNESMSEFMLQLTSPCIDAGLTCPVSISITLESFDLREPVMMRAPMKAIDALARGHFNARTDCRRASVV